MSLPNDFTLNNTLFTDVEWDTNSDGSMFATLGYITINGEPVLLSDDELDELSDKTDEILIFNKHK